ncbi:bifunctional non-homologous end joining protein LigD [Filomicrobium insigne]|uniref:DNA ligase (ATP) n=1 Tax=Filomicrobium insigne TaxID=418854 RepID=A0A1H0Q4H2_9HYPH|nr:DNA ligase D [Filomicrobium insigne]SDP11538.1 bifunctional non-homologous end joining protein LigD [Filomicrobium insigne]
MTSRTKTQALRLNTYAAKRDFKRTPEPPPTRGTARNKSQSHIFVVQHHIARRDHFDLRLEIDGTLKSWAVTRGPSALPGTRRLAVRTEDHPLDYASFEGVIPEKSYGAGTVMLWDHGTWSGASDKEMLHNLTQGHLKFTLHGARIRGRWALVRMGHEGQRENWLLVKDRDAYAEDDDSLAARYSTSVVSGRSMDEIAEGRASYRQASSSRKTTSLLKFIPPMLCTLADKVPEGRDWLYEMKYDGYRTELITGNGAARLFTRNGHDWTDRFPDIAEAAATIPPAILDGEVVVFDAHGLSDFGALAAALGSGPKAPMTFIAFDVLRTGKRDVRGQSLSKRKAHLDTLLATFGKPELIRIAPTLQGSGPKLLERIAKSGGEGIIAKRAGSTYRSGRSKSWLKIKAIAREDAVVIGFTPSSAGRPFASLAVAQSDGDRLRYWGRVGTGFSARTDNELGAKLSRLVRPSPPEGLEGLDLVPKKVRWVAPELRIAVQHRGKTVNGLLRAARYVGLREDLSSGKSHRSSLRGSPVPSPSRQTVSRDTKMPLTHGSRVIFPKVGLTKRDLADYYAEAADLILPHLENRPISVVRAPDGIDGETFFQRHPMKAMKAGIIRVPDPAKSHPDYMALDGSPGLATVVQFGGIELHGWGARLPDLNAPDRMVFDLDPDGEVSFATVRDSAFLVKEVLSSAGLKSFAMATGGKGVHVVVPLNRTQTWDDISGFASGLARRLAKLEPGSFVATASKSRRKGRIFIDWLRNKAMATAIVPYSVRARDVASIACPISWSALKGLESAKPYTVKTIRLSGRQPWAGYFNVDQAIAPRALEMMTS